MICFVNNSNKKNRPDIWDGFSFCVGVKYNVTYELIAAFALSICFFTHALKR